MASEKNEVNSTRCGGLFRRATIWWPSARGWCLIFFLVVTAVLVVFFGAERFLSITDPVDAPILVVEGWLPDYALEVGWQEFEKGHYKTLYTTGGPVKNGWNVEPGDTYASWAASRLRRMVGPRSEIIAAPAAVVKRDRTYASAIGLRNWLQAHHQPITALNIVTVGPHARRSRMLFREAFGPTVKIGVISVPDQEYDRSQWWKYSEGLKEVFSEAATYLYALLFMHFGDKD